MFLQKDISVPETQSKKEGESHDDSDDESTDKTPTENETIALKKEDSDDEKPLPTLAKTLFEEAAQVEQSNVEKPVERRDTDAPVQDQPKTIQDELVDQRFIIFLAFLL